MTTPRYAPYAAMSPFEYKDSMASNTHKMKTLLLENLSKMYKDMHQNSSDKVRIGKMIAELEASLFKTDVYIEDFK